MGWAETDRQSNDCKTIYYPTPEKGDSKLDHKRS